MAIDVHRADGEYVPHVVGEVRYCVGGGACPGLRGKTYTMESLSRRLSAFARSSGRIATVV